MYLVSQEIGKTLGMFTCNYLGWCDYARHVDGSAQLEMHVYISIYIGMS